MHASNATEVKYLYKVTYSKVLGLLVNDVCTCDSSLNLVLNIDGTGCEIGRVKNNLKIRAYFKISKTSIGFNSSQNYMSYMG